jgi:hypothetical protein
MGDDITIGVTEVVNNIEVTAQPNDQIIDIDVIDNSDSVTLNVTPNIIEVNVERGSSFARWGTIYGSILDQTDLQNALFNKADLVNGLVPAYQLPSFVDDVIEVANFASLPTTGETGKLYLTLDNNKIYRWGGSTYVEIASNQAIWGQITGTLSNQTDLQNALNAKQNLLNGTGFVRMSGTSVSYISGLGSQFVKADGSLDNTSYLPLSGGTMTGDLFLRANNNVGGTNYFIGQEMATTDSWKIYGNTIGNDRGELVFELGDNAQSSSGVGQRFRFFYNNSSDGTAKSPFILDYNDAVFDANVTATSFRLTGMSSGNGALYWTSDKVVLSNNNTNGIVDIEALGGSSIATFGNFIDLKRTVFVNSNLWAQSIISRGNPSDSYDGSTYGATPTLIMSVPQTTSDKRSYAFQMNTSSGLDLWYSNAAGVSSRRLTVSSGGNVLIGTTTVTDNSGLTIRPVNGANFAQLAIVGNNASGSNASLYFEAPGQNGCGMFYDRNAGLLRVWSGTTTNGVSLTQFGTSWSSYSDIRLKTDLLPIENALNKIENLRSYTGRYITDDEGKSRSFLIAQDVLEVFPEAVSKSEDEMGTLSLSYTELIPVLVKAVQELKAEIDLLKQKE